MRRSVPGKNTRRKDMKGLVHIVVIFQQRGQKGGVLLLVGDTLGSR